MFLERKDIIFLTFSLRVGKDDKKKSIYQRVIFHVDWQSSSSLVWVYVEDASNTISIMFIFCLFWNMKMRNEFLMCVLK